MIDTNYISTLVEDYIEFKRSLGFELKIIAKRLRKFASYTRSIDYDGYITKDIVQNGFVKVRILKKQEEEDWRYFFRF